MLSSIPEEVLVEVMKARGARCELRTVDQRWRAVVQSRFEVRRFEPPVGEEFYIDFEIDHRSSMAKHLYCAQFGGTHAGEAGGLAGKVTFANWVPAYFRSSPHARRDVRHSLKEGDALLLWRGIAKVLEARQVEEADSEKTSRSVGHLVVSEGHGGCNSKRQVVGRLSSAEAELLLEVLDHRRNEAAVPAVSDNVITVMGA